MAQITSLLTGSNEVLLIFRTVFAKGSEMEKGMCIGSISVAGLLLLLFLMDLFAAVPFGGASSPYMLVDIFGILASGIIGYLAWNAYRDLK